jgi:hypothetical protein
MGAPDTAASREHRPHRTGWPKPSMRRTIRIHVAAILHGGVPRVQ